MAKKILDDDVTKEHVQGLETFFLQKPKGDTQSFMGKVVEDLLNQQREPVGACATKNCSWDSSRIELFIEGLPPRLRRKV